MKRLMSWPRLTLIGFIVFESIWIAWVTKSQKLIDYYAYDVASTAIDRGLSPYELTRAQINAISNDRNIRTSDPVPVYRYSPFLAGVLRPLVKLPALTAAIIWSIGSLIALAISSLLLSDILSNRWIDPQVFIGLAVFVPVLTTFYAGQVNHYLLLAMVLVVWTIHKSNARGAGLSLAIGILLKTIPLALAGWLLLRRNWKALAWLGVCLVILIAITVPLTSFDLYRDYASTALELAGGSNISTAPPNQSLGAMTGRLFGPDIARPLGLGLAALVISLTIIVVVVATIRSDHCDLLSMSVIIAGTSLIAPLSWVHHQVLLAIPLVILLHATRGTRRAAFGWIVSVMVIGALDVVGLAWKQLQASTLLVSIGTYSMVLLWAALIGLILSNPTREILSTSS